MIQQLIQQMEMFYNHKMDSVSGRRQMALLQSSIMIVVVVLIGAVLVAIISPVLNSPVASPFPPEPLLGEQVIFPAGWQPVTCGNIRRSYSCSVFICTDGESYRYCKPMVERVGE